MREPAGGDDTVKLDPREPTTDAAVGAASSQEADEVPRDLQLGRFTLVRLLGRGGMGVVYTAYDNLLDRVVAIKMVRRDRADHNLFARVLREAKALAKLSHPNVVPIFDVGEAGGNVFIAMEYVEGPTLRVWLAERRAAGAGARELMGVLLQAGRGLAAAHAAGFVHRDFKPDNVLVGADGRPRVLDFGLVTTRPGEAAGEPAAPVGRSILTSVDLASTPDVPLTCAGSIVGTPAYMSPEQWLGRQADARSDQFSFCATVYEALYGVRPFAGDDAEEVLAAMKRGELQAPEGAAAAVPGPVAAALRRGLAFRPRERFPDLDALLAALAEGAFGRQRWRKIALGAAALVGAWALALAGVWGWERLQQRRAERQADERLQTAMARVDELQAAGDAGEAERQFAAFVAHPDNRGTAAPGRAWLFKAGQAQRRGEVAPAIDALASAYTVATWPDDQTTALLRLAALFREQMRWPSLLLALAAVERRAGEVGEPAEAAALRLDATLGRRDLGEAAELLRGPMKASPAAAALPVLTALSAATETLHRHRGYAVVVDLDGDGRSELVFETNARDRQLAQIVRADMRLDPVATVDLGLGTFRALSPGPGRPGLLVATDRSGDSAAVVSRLAGDRLVELFRWPDEQIRAALAADVDGDGARELYVGTGPYTRHLVELVEGTDGAWSTRAPAPAVDRRASDVVDLVAGDLDGDGRVELVAALGPWNAYELHVLRHDPRTASLRTVTRRRLGNIVGAAKIAGEGAELVVSKTDEYPSSVVFPRDRPFGAQAGTYLFRLSGGALEETGFAAAPRLAAGERVIDGPPIVGDFDGDGCDEIVICRELGSEHASGERDNTVILVHTGDGALTPVVLGDLRPIAALDLDGDRDDELLVSVSDGDDRDRVWVLGSGQAMLPPLRPQLPRAPAPLRSPDPVIDRMLQRADDLAQMGLSVQSADNLATIAGQVGDPELRAWIELQAAALYEASAADAPAAELYARAAKAPAAAAEAGEGAARSFLRLGRLDAAATHLEALARAPVDADLATALATLRGARVELELRRPLAPDWRIGQALALRRDGARAALHVDAIASGELLSAPVRWAGDSLALEVDLELAQLEWNAGLEIGLVRDGAALIDGSSPIGVDITTIGGANDRAHEIGCVHAGRRAVARIPFTIGGPGDGLGRFTIRATYLPALGELTCEVARGSGEVLLYRRTALAGEPAVGPLRLTLAASRAPHAWVEAEVRGVRLHGAELDPAGDASDDPALVDARRRLVEDDPLGALASLDRVTTATPASRLLTVAALARLGRWTEAERALAEVLAGGPTPAVGGQLDAWLRTAPELFGVLLRGAGGAAAARARLASVWFPQVVKERSPRAYAVAWAGLAERDLEADDHDVLRVHAHAAAALGHHDAAEASFRAALRALDDPRRRASAEEPDNERAAIHLELAALALARGDEAAARRELAPFVGADADPYVVERLRARDDLRALWDLAPE